MSARTTDIFWRTYDNSLRQVARSRHYASPCPNVLSKIGIVAKRILVATLHNIALSILLHIPIPIETLRPDHSRVEILKGVDVRDLSVAVGCGFDAVAAHTKQSLRSVFREVFSNLSKNSSIYAASQQRHGLPLWNT
jgi:hypothetical protein